MDRPPRRTPTSLVEFLQTRRGRHGSKSRSGESAPMIRCHCSRSQEVCANPASWWSHEVRRSAIGTILSVSEHFRSSSPWAIAVSLRADSKPTYAFECSTAFQRRCSHSSRMTNTWPAFCYAASSASRRISASDCQVWLRTTEMLRLAPPGSDAWRASITLPWSCLMI